MINLLSNEIKSRLKHSGIGLGDKLEIYPAYGNKKTICLKKTHLKLSGDQSSCLFIEGIERNQSFELKLISWNKYLSGDEENGRYILRSVTGQPFKVNGQLVFESFIEQGDEVYINHTTLKFKKISQLREDFSSRGEHCCLRDEKFTSGKLSVLIEGETGTGKTHLAKLIHEKSGRVGDFVHLNLSSFSANLIESELFGHKKGAFTGAISDKKGALALADHGTLFLDEMDSLPTALQVKLLLFLDNQKYREVGGVREKQAKARIIFACGKPLESLVRKGMFREDLYFRIMSGHHVKLKPLRDDEKQLERFVDNFCIDHQVTLTPALMEFYHSLPWPGNIRQLKFHLLKKLEMKVSHKLDFDHYDESLIEKSCNIVELSRDCSLSLKQLKQKYALLLYQRLRGDLKLTAKKLGVSSKTLKLMIDNKLSA